jgi:hypothetical protein
MDKISGRGGGGGRRSVTEENQDILRWAKISADQANAEILLSAGEINKLIGRTSTAEIAIDGLNAAVITKASVETVDALTGRVTETESQLTVRAGQIESLVREGGVVSYINQTPESIKISAKHINLEGYVTISNLASNIESVLQEKAVLLTANTLNAVNADVDFLDVGSLTFASNKMYLQSVKIGSVTATSKALVNAVGDLDLSHSHAVTVSDDGTVTLGGAQATGGNFKIADTKAYKDAVSAAASNVYIRSFSGWKSDGKNTVTISNGKTSDVSLPSFSTNSGSWSSGSRTVSVYWRDNNGTNHSAGSATVSVGTVSISWDNSGSYPKVSVSVAGKTTTSTNYSWK